MIFGVRFSVIRILILFGGFDGVGVVKIFELRDVVSMKLNMIL